VKTCNKCKQTKPLSDFHKDKKGKFGVARRCKDCVNEYSKQYRSSRREEMKQRSADWRARNPDKVLKHRREYYQKNSPRMKEYVKQYLKDHPEVKARVRVLRRLQKQAKRFVVTAKDMRRLLSQPCYQCGSMVQLSIDHVIPLSRGGSHGIGNLATLCRKCNSSKGSKLLIEWKYYLKGITDA